MTDCRGPDVVVMSALRHNPIGRVGALPARRGMMVIYGVIALTALLMFVSLAVDFGRVTVAKTELCRAADAAGRYAATGLSINPSTARSRAKLAAADNKVDGASLVLVDSDIELGTWDSSSGSFTALSGSAESGANAVRITAARTKAKGNPIPLTFARVLGLSDCNVSAITICTATNNSLGAFSGLSSVTMGNNTFFGSYNSSTTTSPSQVGSTGKSGVSTNGVLDAGNNSTVDGNVILGPSASVSGLTIDGNTIHAPTNLAIPSMPSWSPGTNPGSVPLNYTVNSNTTLNGGTYWFNSLTVNASLRFSGPSTVYVNGNVALSGSMMPTSLTPSDLKVYQYGAHTFGDGSSNGMNIVAQIVAPYSAFSAKNNLEVRGSAVFDSINVKNNAEFYGDEATGATSGGTTVSTVR